MSLFEKMTFHEHAFKEYKIGAEISPVIPPGLRDFRILLVPSLSKDVQNIGCDLFIHGGVHRL